MKKLSIISLILVSIVSMYREANAEFAFWLYPEANDTRNLVKLEQMHHFKSWVVWYIFDDFWDKEVSFLKNSIKTLGADRVYHVGISPFWFTAGQVASGMYDGGYRKFFQAVKDSRARFLFRTMHEMNGSWFSWSGDSDAFKRAWRHVYGISREMGLTTDNILFVFSVNSEDLPSVDGKIGSDIVYCSIETRKNTGCLTFEDYYPGNDTVDMLGTSLYNWGRGRSESWARWKSFDELLNTPGMDIYTRLASYNKPIFIDEVGTTAVNFNGEWSEEKALYEYNTNTENKEKWILDMQESLPKYPNIVGALYFNQDKTHGLTDRSSIGELDWLALSAGNSKQYSSILSLFEKVQANTDSLPFPENRAKKISKKLFSIINSKSTKAEERKNLLARVYENLKKLDTKNMNEPTQSIIAHILPLIKKRLWG